MYCLGGTSVGEPGEGGRKGITPYISERAFPADGREGVSVERNKRISKVWRRDVLFPMLMVGT